MVLQAVLKFLTLISEIDQFPSLTRLTIYRVQESNPSLENLRVKEAAPDEKLFRKMRIENRIGLERKESNETISKSRSRIEKLQVLCLHKRDRKKEKEEEVE